MELFACGLNAHQQLSSYSINQDRSSQILYNIKKVATGADINIYCTLWCATIIEIDKQLVFRGYHLSGLTECLIVWPSSQRSHGLNSVFGNLSGVVGALAIDGELLELVRNDERPDEMLFRRRSLSWLQQDGNVIDRVSIAGNGVTAVVTHNHSLPSSAPSKFGAFSVISRSGYYGFLTLFFDPSIYNNYLLVTILQRTTFLPDTR